MDEQEQFLYDPKRKQFVDVYDLARHASKVHDNTLLIGDDFTLVNLSEVELRYIREQLLLAKYVKEFLKDKTEASIAQNIILEDVKNMAVLSRARNSKILDAILKSITGETSEQEDTRSTLQKLSDKISGKSEEGKT